MVTAGIIAKKNEEGKLVKFFDMGKDFSSVPGIVGAISGAMRRGNRAANMLSGARMGTAVGAAITFMQGTGDLLSGGSGLETAATAISFADDTNTIVDTMSTDDGTSSEPTQQQTTVSITFDPPSVDRSSPCSVLSIDPSLGYQNGYVAQLCDDGQPTPGSADYSYTTTSPLDGGGDC